MTTELPRNRLGRPRDPTVDDRVLRATTDLLAELTVGEITLDLVAERCGTPKSTIYRRWRSKDELIAAALARYVLTAYQVPDTGRVRDDLIALVEQQFRAYTTRQGLSVVRFAFEWLSGADAPLSDALQEATTRRRAAYLKVIERGQARGELREGVDAELAIDLVFGALWGHLFGGRPVDDALPAAIVDTALRGLGADRPAPPAGAAGAARPVRAARPARRRDSA